MDREKIVKMVVVLAAIVVIAGSLSRLFSSNSMSLSEYAHINGGSDAQEPTAPPEDADAVSTPTPEPPDSSPSPSPEPENIPDPEGDADEAEDIPVSSLTGAVLNGASQADQRFTLEEGFYYEPVSDNLRRYMTGVSYPAEDTGAESPEPPEIAFDELRYVHILHIDYDGNPTEGELVCNAAIAADLTEIFRELYRNEYRLEKVLLIDEYDGDDTASMEDNNTSCFNYRTVDDTDRLSKHAYGLAIDINPLYNPYVTYTEEGAEQVSPASALPYARRDLSFPHKIDEDDLCYELFTRHGFTWGGDWNGVKDYQHFQKTLEPAAP